MSEENVKAVRRLIDAFGTGDPERAWTVALEIIDPQMEMDMTRAPMPDLARVYRGPEEIASFWVKWLEAWGSLGEFGETEVVGVGDEVVFWTTRQTMRGKESGVAVDMPEYAWTMTFRGDRIARATMYPSKAEAIEAAGLL